jgi:hypothetical protein
VGSQHILVHLYECAERDSRQYIYAMLHVGPVGLERINWTTQGFNPMLAMLALSDIQDAASLRFGEGVDLECARRIFEAVKAVKRQPVEFLCLLTEIINPNIGRLPTVGLVLILEVAKQAMAFMDEESVTPLLRPMASGVEHIQLAAASGGWGDRTLPERVAGEAQQICIILKAKYASRFISSMTQLRVLSCARSVTVEQPAMGWLRMHEPL